MKVLWGDKLSIQASSELVMDLNRSGRSSKLSEFQVITEEAEDSGEGSDGKAIGDEFYHSPNSGADGEKIVIASLSVTVTGLLGAHGGGEARGGFHQQQQQQQQQQQEQKQHQTQSLEEATEQEPAYKISPPSSPTSTNNNNNSNSSNLILPTNYPDQSENNQQQPTGQQLHLPFPNPENGQLASQQPLVSHSQGKIQRDNANQSDTYNANQGFLLSPNLMRINSWGAEEIP